MSWRHRRVVLTEVKVGVSGQRHGPELLLPGRAALPFWWGWLGSRAGLDGLRKTENHFPSQGYNHESSSQMLFAVPPKLPPTTLYILFVKVRLTLHLPWRHKEGIEVQLYSFLNLGTRWGGWLAPRSGRFNAWITWYSLYKLQGGPSGSFWTGAEDLAYKGIWSPACPTFS
jgi:hypothetical protein